MKQEHLLITKIEYLTDEIIELTFTSEYLAENAKPGQFLNIKVDDNFPLLRRPFSIFNVSEFSVSIIFNVIGTGTKILSKKKVGDRLDVVGPCGNSFLDVIDDTVDTHIFVAGGIGVAPFPFLLRHSAGLRRFEMYLGGRSKNLIVKKGLDRLHIATDDGSLGYHGTVLDLLRSEYKEYTHGSVQFVLCGPNRMMKAVAEFATQQNAQCFASLECDMACGIGLCQGCNIELASGDKKYALVCKEGTIFDMQKVIL